MSGTSSQGAISATNVSQHQFRRLHVGDADAMAELESLCFSLPWSHAQCRGALSQNNFAAWGVWKAKALIAYISFFHNGDEMEILNLAVHPLARGRGHGRRILSMLLQAGRKMGMQKVALEVRESNLIAIRLYENAGFRLAGLRKRYYSDTGENALIYNCDLTIDVQ